MNSLSPYAPTTLEEAEAFLKRTPAKIEDRGQVIDAVNAAVGWMEGKNGANRRLVARTYRDPVTFAGLLDGTALVTGILIGAAAKVYDDVVGEGLAPGSRVEAIASTQNSLTLNSAATVSGSSSLSFGSAPLQIDGEGSRTFYLGEWPIVAVYSARSLDSEGTASALDLTGLRLERETGRVILMNDSAPLGLMNLEVEAACGYRRPTATERGDPSDWGALQRICHRLCQCYFQDWANAVGRVADKSLGSANFRFVDFEPPKDVLDGIAAYRRLW